MALFPVAAPAIGAIQTDKCPRMLKKGDTVAAKALEPNDVSLIADVDPETSWKITEKGGKFAAYQSRLAATDEQGGDYLHGVSLSQLAEIAVIVGEQLLHNVDLQHCSRIAAAINIPL